MPLRPTAKPLDPLDPFDDVLATRVDSARLQHNLAAFRDVLAEIEKLRRLDLTDVHPAVVFHPASPYEKAT